MYFMYFGKITAVFLKKRHTTELKSGIFTEYDVAMDQNAAAQSQCCLALLALFHVR